MKYLTSTDLAVWAQTLPAQSLLPLLIRKLIHATINSEYIEFIQFPQGEDVQVGGYDGELHLSKGNLYAPGNVSVWEFGVAKDVKSKADKDIEKRMANPLGKNPSCTTYIAVTLRKYTKKKQWAKTRQKEGYWLDVRLYDAVDIEHWLDLAPTVEIWLARILKKPVDGVQDATDCWEEWSNNGTNRISASLLTDSREKQATQFIEFCENITTKKLFIKSNSTMASVGFILATLIKQPKASPFAPKALVVDTARALEHLIESNTPLLLVPTFMPSSNLIHRSALQNHKLIIPVSNSFTNVQENIMNLPIIKGESFRNHLKEMGINREKAQLLAKMTGKDIAVLRRNLGLDNKQPKWLESGNPEELIPLVLLSRFDASYEGDREIIAEITGNDFNAYELTLKKILHSDEAAVYYIGSKWRVISHTDTWLHLARYINEDHINKFEKLARKVLGEVPEEPTREEPLSMFNFQSTPYRYSAYLKQGICETMIILAVYARPYGLQISQDPESLVDFIVKELLEKGGADQLRSLGPHFPLLAEAAPFKFANATLKAGQEGTLDDFFTEKKGWFHTSNNLPHLLWALENLAWMPELLTLAVRNLCVLIRRAPQKLPTANTPFNTLQSIFRIWFPQTNANAAQRKKVLEILKEEFPEIAFNLIQSLLYHHSDHANMNHKMQWRLFSETREISVEREEFMRMQDFCLQTLLDLTESTNLQQHLTLLSKLGNVNPLQIEKILQRIRLFNPHNEHDKVAIYNAFRKMLGRHRTHPRTSWSLPENILRQLEEVAEIFEPEDFILKDSYLFEEHHPTPIQGFEEIAKEYDLQTKFINEERIKFVEKVLDQFGFGRLMSMAENSEHPGLFGDTLAKIKVPDTLEIRIFQLLNGESPQLREFVSEYIATAAVRNDLTSLWNKFLEVIKKEAIPPEKNVFFLLALPCTLELFLKIEELENTVYEELYWKKIDRWIPAENPVLIFAIRKFSIYDRPISALNTMGKLNFDGELETAYLQKTLQELNFNVIDEPVGVHLDSYGCREVFKELHDRKNADKELMAKVELKYLFLFEDVSHGIYPQYLFQEIALNPELFVHFIKIFYVTDDTGEADASMKEMSDAQQVMIGKNAYYILRNFNCIPGMEKEGSIDAAKLESWIDQVRLLATVCHRLRVADENIGSLLGRYPNGSMPMFFPVEIYNILERLNSRAMKSGFSIELFNRMGITSRSLDAGGDIERNRALIFKNLKEEVEISHPHVAEIFRNLEKDFESQALREDEEAIYNIVEY